MTLVKNKTKINPAMRKVAGDHHRKSGKYLKTYWPYIPIILILGGSLLAGEYLPTSLNGASASGSTRISSVTGSNTVFLDLTYLALACLGAWFVVRHFKRLKSCVLESEEYLARHYVLDITLGVVIGSLFILAT